MSLSNVRIHTDRNATQLASRLSARAFTRGSDIYFRNGIDMSDSADRTLLGHELAHIAQQRESKPSHGGIGEQFGSHERHADAFAAALEAGRAVPVPPTNAAGGLQRKVYGDRSKSQIVADAIANEDIGDAESSVLMDEGYASVEFGDKIKLIDLIRKQFWVGLFDEWALEAIWNSFGSRIAEAWADDGGDRWTHCVAKGANLSRIATLKTDMDLFAGDVIDLAYHCLGDNADFVNHEKELMNLPDRPAESPSGGVPQEATSGGVPDAGVRSAGASDAGVTKGRPLTDPAVASARLQEVQNLATQAAQAESIRNVLLNTVVGTKQTFRHGAGHEPIEVTVDVRFDPVQKPESEPTAQALASHHARTWNDVNEDNKLVNTIIRGIGIRSPAVYAAIQQGRVAELASPATAADTARDALNDVLVHIRNAYVKLGSGDLDYRDMQPLHEQLFAGGKTKSGHDWTNAFYRSMVAAELETHGTEEMLKTLGLATIEAAAFILSELATGGLATGFWVGVGIGAGTVQAASSWEKASALTALGGAAASPERELIASGKAAAAQIQAVLDTLALAVGVVGAVGTLAKAGGEAAQMAKLIDELGVAGAMERSGKTSAELLEVVGKDSRQAAVIEDHMVDEVFAKLEKGEISQQEGVLQIERRAKGKPADPTQVPDIGRGVTRELVAKVRNVTNKTISQAPKEVQEAWAKAADFARKKLGSDASKEAMAEAYDIARDQFWARVRADTTAKTWFEESGMIFEGSSGAPYIEAIKDFGTTTTIKQEFRISLDHILPKGQYPTFALDAGNLRFVTHWDNWLLNELAKKLAQIPK